MIKVIWLVAGGALGTVARYGLAGLVQRNGSGAFPWGTLVVNILGCFAFGLIWGLAEDRLALGVEARMLALTGFMGAFTTFSTFIFETSMLLQEARWLTAAANLLMHNSVGIVFLFLGLVAARTF